MARLTFSGGIHPYDGKDMSKSKPIKDVDPKGELVYPLSQHIGAPARPVVAKGDHVLAGQLIAEAGGFVSAPIYASVSGIVKNIEPRRVVTGDNVMSIVIENDGAYEEVEWPAAIDFDSEEYAAMTKEEKIERIRKAGIVGMGGAGFPTAVKLSPKEPDKIEYVIVNCAECEPYLTSDYRKMLEEPEKLIGGLKIALSLFDNARGILAVEDNKPDCITRLKHLTKDETKITVKALKTKYPQGSERQLIFAATGRAINSSMLPSDVGCIVNNVDTVISIYNAVMEGKPLMYRIVTVTGDAIADPRNFRVRIGTLYEELVEEAGGFKEPPVKIVSGGPMMGFGIFDLKVPTTKTSSALLCMTKDDVSAMEPSACINCGKCVEVCPGRVVPKKLAEYAEHYDEEAFVKNNGMECCLPRKRSRGEKEMSQLMKVSSNPHVRSHITTSNIMLAVIIALLPAAGFGIYNFGLDALILILVTVATTVLTEYIYEKLMHKPVTIGDYSAVVTGLLLALNLPSTAPWWIGVVGGIFAILVVKMLFGGLGQNFMNPALGARCFLLISYTSIMCDFNTDAYSGATPLAQLKAGENCVCLADADLIRRSSAHI